MSKLFNLIVSDPPYPFSDTLTMSDVKRGSASNYATLSINDIKNLDVKSIAADNAVLALWCPSSLLKEGIEIMESWGFVMKQTHILVKIKINPFKDICKTLLSSGVKDLKAGLLSIGSAELTDTLAFGMGRLFRQCHEVCLIGTRGKVYGQLMNKSQRSVHFYPVLKHSQKPDALQKMLEKMFPVANKLEMFARRDLSGWTCIGLEINNEDIRDSIKRFNNETS